MALNTHRQYGKANSGLSQSAEKLSSGYRINRAGDDAAGLAISEKMRAQIRGLNMASKNSMDGISLIQTAEGALQESQNIVQRMRELAVQAASDTNHDKVDREALDEEYRQLMNEVDNVADTTRFNNMNLLDGSLMHGPQAYILYGQSNIGKHAKIKVDTSGWDGSTSDQLKSLTIRFIKTSSNAFKLDVAYESIDGETNALSHPNNPHNPSDQYLHRATYGANNLSYQYTLDNLTAAEFASLPDGELEDYGFSANFKVLSGKDLALQTGANQGDTLKLSIPRMDSSTLGLRDNDITSNLLTQAKASEAITACDNAINAISTQRAQLGAVQNRLQHKVSNLDTSAENLQASESRIRDVDIAKEMSGFTKHNILVQAATSMLAQANQSPQNMLSLLR